MLSKIKTLFRDGLPPAWQVPVKFRFAQLRGHLEPEMALLPQLVRRGDHVIDVGGNRGVYAYRLAQLGARVEVFEPNAACHQVLSPWAARCACVTIHAVALSAEEGEGKLVVPVDRDGVEHDSSGSLEHGVVGRNARTTLVPLRTLDSYAFKQVTLIKIDVEGHEANVIAGARDTIAASKPALLVEIEQRHLTRPIAEVFSEIVGLGYVGFFEKNGRLTPIGAFDPAVDQALENLGSSHEYRNNFLFLSELGVAEGRYATMLKVGR